MENEVPGLDHVMSVLARSEERLHEQLNTSFKWVLGTLFTANGGALVALLGNEKIAAHPPLLALACFALGVLFSIGMGISNAVFATQAIMPTTDLQMTFAMFSAGQAEAEDVSNKMNEVAAQGHNPARWSLYVTGTLSLLCLIAGMIAFGFVIGGC